MRRVWKVRQALNRRLGGAAADRGTKDIRTVAALLRAGMLPDTELSQRVESVRMSPALMVEAGLVFDETIAAARA